MDFATCSDITEDDVLESITSPEALRALLDRAATIAVPGEGAPKVLLAVARLPQASWLRGQLVVEIQGNERETTLAISADLSGKRVSVTPVVTFRVPLDEFTRAVRIAPRLVSPLSVVEREPRIVLRGPVAQRPSNRPTRQAMIPVPPEAKRSNPRLPAIARDGKRTSPPEAHTKKTITSMEPVRIADRPEARREDQSDIDEAWEDDK